MATPKQRKQQTLSWTLYVVMGAQGTLYPRERMLSPEVRQSLLSIHDQLKEIEAQLRL